MAGIGKYKKEQAFNLKSGNKPSFRGMGSSPFHAEETKPKEEEEVTPGSPSESPTDPDSKEPVAKEDGTWTKIAKIGANALIGGFDHLYGTETARPKINFAKHEEEVDDASPESKVSSLLGEDYKLGDLTYGKPKNPSTKIQGSLTDKPKDNRFGGASLTK